MKFIKLYEEYEGKFYAGYPEEEYFRDYVISSSYKPGISLFECSPINKQKATFKMLSDESIIKLVKNTYTEYFKPACILSNLPKMSTNHIKTEEDGVIEFNGKDWKITKKATIIFLPAESYKNTENNQKNTNNEPILNKYKMEFKISFTTKGSDKETENIILIINAKNEQEAKTKLKEFIQSKVDVKILNIIKL